MLKDYALKILKKSLEYDVGFGDITTNSIIPEGVKAKGVIKAKEKCIVCGIDFIVAFFEEYGIKCKKLFNDGEEAYGNILEFEGDARTILMLERTALNLLMHLSGIATMTNRIVKKAKSVNKNVRVACTRKTLPLLSPLQKYAVYIGGGDTHRFRLDDCVLIKDNHIAIVGVKEAIRRAKENVSFTKKIEVEVSNLKELREALEERADIIMLDNFKPEEIEEALKIIDEFERKTNFKPIIEVSGGIKEDNILEYAKYNVDVISMGALTHSVKSVDMSLDIVRYQ
ncbi:nicotinate-nucleotide pyrophosphorylase (nadC) [Methanocaldococcus jannaschii DSM 2661]|uniref:Probable nicotinate-nucleotide pyrophosphorylase [carboxylating] n=1 Tax=Methanocaldococcus jannaschii (strain ATCC 43067 / DSM 2661 / JAL-1 / JCM 10045 / NBRC 100440) TaxID=243232 RepID=NADC_METJA|nr:carboxylating nicotinate-nucleotide diphosphorylase [Methanocaldococcus jannaschii]Q57916.1 RecName: Full=Probable nicotinate-nucleotide pyrophosphorylase [carboxylating]; AltName: Full=Quinolinate phosphoribosyltransferase [decarboxylating]; Short=QAPRTase [Methanocaldococcus jannaschii DSM 2661]AAB98483.1 nicotinate-nucleotide pyrophosphorylase (nadC) [Methanocaldococcus jannaschii DSM 2661]